MPSKFSRRDMLKLTGLTAAAAITPAGLASCASAQTTPAASTTSRSNTGSTGSQNRKPKNIIFMVADGMSTGTLTLAESFSRMVRDPATPTNWVSIMQDTASTQGMVETCSLDSIVTDSSAAASAWGSGSRVNNGTLNILPNGETITPLAKLVKQSGRSMGLVSTCTITHATPAGFAVNVDKRDSEQAVAEQYLNQVDVLLGGGTKFFSAQTRKDKRDLLSEFQQAGYAMWHHRDQLMANQNAAAAPKILGTFSPSYLPFTIDQQQDPELIASVPTLAEMTAAALDSLSQNDQGFFLMVEGGKVDHCAHVNDAAGAMWEQLAFDDAIGVARQFAQKNPDTLIVLTTDHANANPGLNGSRDANTCFERLANFKVSTFVVMEAFKKHGKDITPEQVSQILNEASQIEIKAPHIDAMTKVLQRQPISRLNQYHTSPVFTLGQLLCNYTNIGWTGTSHTADYATVTAIGPGADRFAGFGKNTDAYKHITSFFDIKHVNPSMKPTQSWRTAMNQNVYEHAVEFEALV